MKMEQKSNKHNKQKFKIFKYFSKFVALFLVVVMAVAPVAGFALDEIQEYHNDNYPYTPFDEGVLEVTYFESIDMVDEHHNIIRTTYSHDDVEEMVFYDKTMFCEYVLEEMIELGIINPRMNLQLYQEDPYSVIIYNPPLDESPYSHLLFVPSPYDLVYPYQLPEDFISIVPFSTRPAIWQPGFEGMHVPQQILHIRWLAVPGATYHLSIRNLTTGLPIRERVPMGTATHAILRQDYFTQGHTFRIAVAAVVGGQEFWYERIFLSVTNIVTVNFQGGGASGQPPMPVNVTTPGQLMLPWPANLHRPGYTFGGWMTPHGAVWPAGNRLYWDWATNGTLTLTATWNRAAPYLFVSQTSFATSTHHPFLTHFDIQTNQSSWSASSNQAWLSTGRSENSWSTTGWLRVWADAPNPSTSPRTAIVTVWAGTAQPRTITVTQAGRPPEVTVSFNANGGTVSPTSRTVFAGWSLAAAELPIPIPTRTNHTFGAWWTSQTGGTQVSAITPIHTNTTWFARWHSNVTFNANGGTLVGGRTVVSGNAVGNLPTTTRAGHTFDGWWTAQTGGQQINDNTPVNGHTTFWARWTAQTVTLTVSPTSWNAPRTAGSTNFTITTNQPIANVTVTSNATSWLTVTGTGTTRTIHVTTNSGTASRTGQITVSVGGQTRVISVTQAGIVNWNPSPFGDVTYINVTSNNPTWTFNNTQAQQWLTVTRVGNRLRIEARHNVPDAGFDVFAYGDIYSHMYGIFESGELYYHDGEYLLPTPFTSVGRTASINIVDNGTRTEVSVSQGTPNAQITVVHEGNRVPFTEWNGVPASGGRVTVRVDTQPLSAIQHIRVLSGSYWISIGSGVALREIVAQPNPTSTPRVGEVAVLIPGQSGIRRIPVRQDGGDPFFEFYGGLGFLFPLPHSIHTRHISSGFGRTRTFYINGVRHQDQHQGIDMASPHGNDSQGRNLIRGEPIFVAHSGYVRRTGWETGAGWRVTLESEVLGTRNLPIVSRYMHLLYDTTPQAPLHGWIEQGTRIGSVGNTGQSTNYHLHLDFNNRGIVGGLNNNAMNPERFFPNISFTGDSNRIP